MGLYGGPRLSANMAVEEPAPGPSRHSAGSGEMTSDVVTGLEKLWHILLSKLDEPDVSSRRPRRRPVSCPVGVMAGSMSGSFPRLGGVKMSTLPGSIIGWSSDRWKPVDGNPEAGRGRSEGPGVATGGTGM